MHNATCSCTIQIQLILSATAQNHLGVALGKREERERVGERELEGQRKLR